MASFAGKSAPLVAIELGRRRVCAVAGRRSGDGLIVDRVVSAAIPSAVDRDDPAAIGAFLAEKLTEAEFPRGPVVAVVGRDAVAVKRLELPTTAAHELPEMVRLAMRRELPMEGAATIDFLADGSRDGASSVLSVAAPDAAVAALVVSIESAGRRVDRVALRTLGAAGLAEARPAGPSLVLDIGAESMDFTVVDDGRIAFSRGAGLRGDIDSAAAVADAAIAEAKRTWLSYRAANSTHAEFADVTLVADSAVAERARPALAELLGVPVRIADNPPGIRLDERVRALGAALPLAMVLRDGVLGAATIDLRHPRQAPDVAARRRQLVLAGVGLLVVAAIAGFTFGRRAARLDAERRADIVDKARQFASEGRRLRRDEDKLSHLRQWSLPPQDIIADLLHMKSLLPEPGDVVIDSVAASEEFKGVRWDKDKGWSSAADVRIVLEGEAKTRAIADALRERLVEDKQFVVTTSGSDTRGGNRLPYPFGYLMRSDRKAGDVATSSTSAAVGESGKPAASSAPASAPATSPTTEDAP